MDSHVSCGDTSQYLLQSSAMPGCVGIPSPGFVGVGMAVVRVVGVEALPTQYQVSCLISEQSSDTDGFQLIKSALLKVPNMRAMRSQESSTPISYLYKLEIE